MTSLEIRRVGPAEWKLYRELRLAALRDSPDAFASTLARERGFTRWTWKSRLRFAVTVIAYLDGRPVGTATLIGDRRVASGREIVAMWVRPDARGQGIASQLLTHLVEVARTDGASRIALWVADGNDAARRVYLAAGFEPTGDRDVIRDGLGEELLARVLDVR
jgi:GNAT superfamily N-acetyltransferase